MHVEIINKSNNPNPEYQTDQSAGMDLRAYLEKNEYMVGNQFTAADILISQTLMWAKLVQFDHELPHLNEYMKRMSQREAFKRTREN